MKPDPAHRDPDAIDPPAAVPALVDARDAMLAAADAAKRAGMGAVAAMIARDATRFHQDYVDPLQKMQRGLSARPSRRAAGRAS